MTIIGVVLVLGLAVVAAGAAGLMLWSGWLALKDEVLPGFRMVRPNPGSLVLTALGVVLPILMIAAFTLYLAIWMLQVAFSAL
ncbi:MAG TPA: hypothetical protein VFZ66_08535 [Herpetosiphonaceae bacterium]